MTIVGLVMRDSRISPPANINMVSDLPEPWVCQITPPRPSPVPDGGLRRASTLARALRTARNWW